MSTTHTWHTRTIPLGDIDEAASSAAQCRVSINWTAVEEYAAALESGEKFPPVTLFFEDPKRCILADGFHRFHAHRKAGRDTILAQVATGNAQDALVFACAANATHGLRRSAGDKRRAVALLLGEGGFGDLSDRLIAEMARVSHSFVGRVRAELAESQRPAATGFVSSCEPDREPTVERRRGADGRTRQVSPRAAAKIAPAAPAGRAKSPASAAECGDPVDAANWQRPDVTGAVQKQSAPASRPEQAPTAKPVDESLAALIGAFTKAPGWTATRLKKARAIVNRIAAELSQLVLVAPEGDALALGRQQIHASRVALEQAADAMVKGGRI